ncbi:hypothetical protein [Sphingomonas sp. LM7]|uniref:hypothetical protein n=1 Tax=Sphingomonas sp. LM7 TaxID=1938607 RepID=UPI0009840871|nr:hypothetical protein [Sphingomonas sp. LM7]AQR73393.1 hypothetical protein BXU08_06805 [Sphingomonas sp. LM7]
MTAILRRLESGERWWAAGALLRSFGLAMLVAALTAGCWVCRSVGHLPAHPATPFEFAGATTVAIGLSLGSAFTFEGAGLFRAIPVPPRARVFPA